MDMLSTPLGKIAILFDGKQIDYKPIRLDKDDVLFPNIDGRYKIVFQCERDNMEHSLACVIYDVVLNMTKIGPESGEGLEALAFYQKDIKVTIGAEGEESYFPEYSSLNQYDYGISYLDNGIEYNISASTKTNIFVFGISWIMPCTEVNDYQTWYGADPSFM